jgi:hypothetical protein
MMTDTLFVSLWELCLDNLPVGRFERREVSAADAREMICAARAADRLVCVSEEDLLAPYKRKERQRHEELCAVLRRREEFPLSLDDFCASDEEDPPMKHIRPLQLAEVREGDRLLVISCAYQLAAERTGAKAVEGLLQIAEDSLSFSVIEALSAGGLRREA